MSTAVRALASLIIGLFLTGLLIPPTVAAADSTSPVLTSVSMESPKTLRVGEQLKIKWTATDQNAVRSMHFWVYAPDGRIKYASSSTSSTVGTTSSGVAVTNAVESLTWPEGTYRVEFAQFSDIAGNSADTRYGNALSTGVDLGALSFDVTHESRPVIPAAVTFTDEDGTASDAYTIPATDGVDYLVDGQVKPAGTYPGAGTVEVTARAKTDYVLAEGATSSWSQAFDTTATVSAAVPVFTDKSGTAYDTYAVPAKTGVQYYVNGVAKAAGTYKGSGTITVTAKAKTGYALTGTTTWKRTFATTVTVTPAVPVFADKSGTTYDRYTIPTKTGVQYYVNGVAKVAGTYKASGTITVTAKAKTGYALTGTTTWKRTFSKNVVVTPTAVTFTDKSGTTYDRYTIPTKTGVQYYVNGVAKVAGTYKASGTITVTAKAKTGYALTGTTTWKRTFGR